MVNFLILGKLLLRLKRWKMRKMIAALWVIMGLLASYAGYADDQAVDATPSSTQQMDQLSGNTDSNIPENQTQDIPNNQEDPELKGLEFAPADDGNSPDYD